MDLHSGEQIIFKGRPSWRSTLLFYIGGLLAAAAAGAIAALVDSTGLGVAVAAGVFVIVLLVGFLRRYGTQYIVTNERLHIRRGIIAKHVQETRLERVQNVNTDQSVFERVLQIGTVDFDTAGTTDSDFAFDGISQPERVVQAVDRAHRAQTAPPAAAAPAPPPPPADAPSATAE
jgi:uncharacterized membrane protein YdbT with pleckstrin-like domain